MAMSLFLLTHTHTHTYIHTYIHTHTYTLTRTYTHTHMHTHIHMHTHVHVHVHTHMHIHTHIHMHSYTHAGEYNCFLNVIIQSLWHLRPFREALLRLQLPPSSASCTPTQATPSYTKATSQVRYGEHDSDFQALLC